jgi:hypothetical protein
MSPRLAAQISFGDWQYDIDEVRTSMSKLPEVDRLMSMDQLTLVNKVLHLRYTLHAVVGAIQKSAADTVWMNSSCPETVVEFIENMLEIE